MPIPILQSLKTLIFFQVALILVGGGGLYAYGDFGLGASFAVGGLLMLGNLLALAWSSWRMLGKKPIASTVLIIVIKYALLLGSVFYLARCDWFNPLGAGLGIASFMLAILGAALMMRKKEDQIGSSSL